MKKNKFSKLFMVICLGVLAFFVSACDALNSGNSNKSVPPTTLPKPTVPSGPLSADQIFTLASERMDELNSYGFSENIRYEVPELIYRFNMTSAGDASADEGIYSKITTIESQDGVTNTSKVELLYVFNPDKVYERNVPGAKWQVSEQSISFGLKDIQDMKTQASNVTLVGEEKLNGAIKCYHLSIDLPPEYLAESIGWVITSPTIRVDMWISTDELLVRSFTQEFSGISDGFDIPQVTVTTNIFNINKAVFIPSPFEP